jgi:hypothetical protein
MFLKKIKTIIDDFLKIAKPTNISPNIGWRQGYFMNNSNVPTFLWVKILKLFVKTSKKWWVGS